jgi:WD40 repeat protein
MCKRFFLLLTFAALFLEAARGQQPGQAAIVISSPDKKLTVTALDKAITISDAQTQKEVIKLLGHTGPITALAISPDGKHLASGSQDKTVALWNIRDGRQVLRIQSGAAVTSLTITPDGKTLSARIADKTRIDWDLATGKVLRKVKEK